MSKSRIVGSVLALSFGLAAVAQASLLSSDGYEVGAGNYTTGGIGGQSSGAATGFMGAWTSSSANLGVDTISLQNPVVSYDDASTGKGKFTASVAFSDFYRKAEHQLSPVAAPADNTFYMSHLVNAGTLVPTGDTNEGYGFVGFGSFVDQGRIEGTANALLGAFVGVVDSATAPDGVDLVLRSRTGFGPEVVTDTPLVSDAENNTYLVIMKLVFNSPGDSIAYWVNPADVSSDAAMTGSSLATGVVNGFQLSAASDMNRLTVTTLSLDRSFFWDESRLATSLQALIPEPSSMVLLAAGGLALLRRRR